MSRLIDRIDESMRAVPPFTTLASVPFVSQTDQYTPDKYGDYLATSNDVYTAAWLRAKMLAKLPWQAFRQNEELDSHAVLDLLNNPNPFFTDLRFKAHLELCLAIWGQVYVTIEKNGAGRPVELWPIKPSLMAPVPDRNDFIRGYLFFPPGQGQPVPFLEDEVIWITYPNPGDWYSALPPMGAARLAADIATAAQQANRNLFSQGMLSGGFVTPAAGSTFTKDQAQDLETLFDRRFRGVDKAHRWTVIAQEFGIKQMSVTPKDAEFVEGMNLSFRQVCRAFGVPPPLVGDAEFATLANLRVYERLFWEHTGQFEARYVAAEFTRQLLPSYPDVTEIGLDLAEVVALQEDESERWSRESGQLEKGVITVNEWREANGLEPLDFPDTPKQTERFAWHLTTGAFTINEWRQEQGLSPVSWGNEPLVQQGPGMEDRARLAVRSRAFDKHTDRFATELRGFFDRQRDDVLRRVRAGETGTPFDMDSWNEKAEETAFPRILAIMESAYDQAVEELRAVGDKSNLRRKATLQAGQLAGEMNTTTFKELRLAMRKTLDAGGGIDELVAAVNEVMARAHGRRARLIAESETTGAATDGQLDAWTAFPAVIRKKWVTAHDERVRSSHAALDGTSVGLEDLFYVGACSGPGPGRTGCAGEDINCRCVLAPVLAEPEPRAVSDTLTALKEALK